MTKRVREFELPWRGRRRFVERMTIDIPTSSVHIGARVLSGRLVVFHEVTDGIVELDRMQYISIPNGLPIPIEAYEHLKTFEYKEVTYHLYRGYRISVDMAERLDYNDHDPHGGTAHVTTDERDQTR